MWFSVRASYPFYASIASARTSSFHCVNSLKLHKTHLLSVGHFPAAAPTTPFPSLPLPQLSPTTPAKSSVPHPPPFLCPSPPARDGSILSLHPPPRVWAGSNLCVCLFVCVCHFTCWFTPKPVSPNQSFVKPIDKWIS